MSFISFDIKFYLTLGSRPNDNQNYPNTHQTIHSNHIQAPQLRRELPKDLSKEEILKEAALVLSHAERVRCTTDNGNDTFGNRLKNRIDRKKGKIFSFNKK